MMMQSQVGPMDSEAVSNYIGVLVNQFFKILPMREAETVSLGTYMESLQLEVYGCASLVNSLYCDEKFLSLLSILQYLIDNPVSEVCVYKREVFKAIGICNKLRDKYAKEV